MASSKYDTKNQYKSFMYSLFLVLNASLGVFMTGYSIGELSLIIVALQHVYSWSESETTFYTGLLNGLLPFGAIIGALFSGRFFDKIPRHYGLLIADSLGFFASLFCIMTGSYAYPQIIGRLIIGVSSGINGHLVILYINELTPKKIRGFMGSLFQTAMCFGTISGYLIALNVPDDTPDYDITDNWWRIVYGFPALTCLIRGILLMTVYNFDTPFSLMKRQKNFEVEVVLRKIYKDEFIEEIHQTIENSSFNSDDKNISYMELFRLYSKRLVLGGTIALVQQLTGINAVLTESSTLYGDIWDDSVVKILTVMNSFILLTSSLCSGYLIDKYGRRPVFLLGVLGCSLSMFLMGIFEEFSMEETSIFMLFVYMIVFGLSLGSVCCCYFPEILPFKGISATFIISSTISLLIEFLVPVVYSWIGLSPIFFFFGFSQICLYPYLYFNVKETKGKTPIEIDEMFDF